jgi:hypothetical protein
MRTAVRNATSALRKGSRAQPSPAATPHTAHRQDSNSHKKDVFLPAEGDEGRSLFTFNRAADERSFWHRARIDTFTGLGCGLDERGSEARFGSGQEQEIASSVALVLQSVHRAWCCWSTGKDCTGLDCHCAHLECQEELG